MCEKCIPLIYLSKASPTDQWWHIRRQLWQKDKLKKHSVIKQNKLT